jgi:hypothetical protein
VLSKIDESYDSTFRGQGGSELANRQNLPFNSPLQKTVYAVHNRARSILQSSQESTEGDNLEIGYTTAYERLRRK